MFNRIQAKEKAKTILRQRTFLDAFGYGWVLVALLCCTVLPVLMVVWPTVLGSLVSSALSSYGSLGLAGFVGLAASAVILFAVIALVFLCVIVCAGLLFHAGMVRATLRLNRRDTQVRVLDTVLAGDRLGVYIRVTLWQILFLIVWNLPGVAALLLGVLLAGTFTTTGMVFAIILWIAAGIWNVYITINKLCQYFFSYHVAEDNRKMAALDCLRESGKLIEGHKFDLFVTVLSFLGWNILSVTILCNVFTIPYQYITYSAIYEQLLGTFQASSRTEMLWRSNGKKRAVAGGSQPSGEQAAAGAIRIMSGEYAGSTFPLNGKEELKIGRDPKKANIVIDANNHSISGLHCGIRFDVTENAYYVTDYSSNGTFVEEKRLPFEVNVRTARNAVVRLADGAMVLRLV